MKLNFIKYLLIVCWIAFYTIIYINLDGLQFNNSKWFDPSHPSELNLNLLQKKFQNYENLAIVVDFNEDIFQSKILNTIDNLSQEFLKIENVIEVLSPLSASFLLEQNNSLENTTYKKALDKNYFINLDQFKNEFIQSPYYLKILSQDLKKVSLIIKMDTLNNEHKRQKAVEEIINIIQNDKQIPDFKIAGNGYLNYELNKQSKNNLISLTFIILIFVCLLSIIIGGIRRLIVVLGIVAITMGLSLLIIKINGHYLTSITIALIIMVMIVGISDAFHISSYYEYLFTNQNNQAIQDYANKLTNIKLAIKKNYLPCFLTSLTTAVGFFSFAFSALVPLKNFALDASIVIILSFIFNLLYMLSIMYILPAPAKRKQGRVIKFYHKINATILNKLADFSLIYYKKIVLVSFGIMIAMFGAFPFAKTQSNFLDIFFAKNSNIYKNFIYLDEFFSGSGSINILVKSDHLDYFRSYEAQKKIIDLSDKFSKINNVKSVESYLVPLHMVHQKLKTSNSEYPQNDDEVGQELLFLDLSRDDKNSGVMSSYIDFNYKIANITLHTNNLQSNDIIKLLKELESLLKQANITNYSITGNNEYFYSVSQEVLNTQFISIILCYLIIYIIFIIFFKVKLAGLSIASAIFPIVFVLTSIILSGTSFDFAVVLVSSIALGLGVDNTLHILYNYLSTQKETNNLDERLKKAFIIPGSAIIQSALLFAMASLIFIYSDLIMIKKFGIFLFASIIVSFFSSTILFVSMLKMFNKYIYKN